MINPKVGLSNKPHISFFWFPFIPFIHYEHDDDKKGSNIDPLPSTPFIYQKEQQNLKKLSF